MCDLTYRAIVARNTSPGNRANLKRRSTFATHGSGVSVPKILTLFIPEILSHPAIAGRAKTLSVPPVGEPVGRREEDVRNVKASRSLNSTEDRALQGRSGPSGGSVSMLY